jgi:hypothetical protein
MLTKEDPSKNVPFLGRRRQKLYSVTLGASTTESGGPRLRVFWIEAK